MSITTGSDTVAPVLTGELSLNDIAQREPRALEVFNRLGLDTCCGGAKPLALVCERHRLSLDDVLDELRALISV